MNGIGLVVLVAGRLASPASPSLAGTPGAGGLPMTADTAIFALKFGWLFAFLVFLRRFALPIGDRTFRRLVAAILLPAAVLVAVGWLEFLLAARRGLFDKLQYVSDYLVFFLMIGAGLFLRSRTAGLVGREAAKAALVLGSFTASIFLALGVWWIAGDSVSRFAPALWTAFIPLIFLAFNGGLAFWVLRFSKVLAAPETMRFSRRRIPGDLLSRLGISRRESEIIELVGQGLSNQEIADRLFISLYTVKKHLNNVFLKAGVANRVQLARLFSGAASAPAGGPEGAHPVGAGKE